MQEAKGVAKIIMYNGAAGLYTGWLQISEVKMDYCGIAVSDCNLAQQQGSL